ncbi:MAG: DUF456 domain-containing protein [Chloroflexota bacterium]
MSQWLEIPLKSLTLLIMLVGVLGVIVPIYPGIVVIWLVALGYGLAVGFGSLGGWLFALLTVLMLVGTLADNILMGTGARKKGASWYAIGAGLVAGIGVTILWPPFGGLIAAPIVLLLVEYLIKRNWKEAFDATRGLVLGCGWSYVIRLGIALLMVLIWVIWAWKG